MPPDARPTADSPDDDPYLWLEDIDGARALAWVDGQNRATLAHLAGAVLERDRDALAAIYDRPDNIPFVTRRGAALYNFWKDAANPRGLWRRTSLESFRTAAPVWEVLLDLDRLAADEKEDWVWSGAITLPPAHDRAIVSLSRGGGDAVMLREFDLAARRFLPDGFHLPEAKGGADWLDRDTLVLSTARGDATRSGYPRTARLWRRGTPSESAPVLFETTPDSMGVWAAVDRTQAHETIWFSEKPGFFETVVWLGDRTGVRVRLDLPPDARVAAHRGWLAFSLRRDWSVGGTAYQAGCVLGIALDAVLAGSRDFKVLFLPGERRVLRHVFWSNGRLVLAILDDLRPVFEVLTPAPGTWARDQLTGLPPLGIVQVWRLDAEESEANGDLLANVQDPLTPPSLLLLQPGQAPAVLKRAPETFKNPGLTVTRHEAISSDGTRVPYVQVGPAGITGEAPVHLSGYGGFEIAHLPGYNSALGKLWLERGGTSVTACLRGGGEFGPRWHQAGIRDRKPLSHDDFAAVAADLVARGVTRPARIAAEGGSNGGILITNMLTRYPERFGALFCTIPLVDMRRFSRLLAGASWIAEYGDPDKPEDWAFMRGYSAYHQAAPGRRYPPILLATTRRDDRVHPGHARKMAAKLQAMGYQAWFYEPAAGGHGYGKDNRERALFTALGYVFLRRAIGWSD